MPHMRLRETTCLLLSLKIRIFYYDKECYSKLCNFNPFFSFYYSMYNT